MTDDPTAYCEPTELQLRAVGWRWLADLRKHAEEGCRYDGRYESDGLAGSDRPGDLQDEGGLPLVRGATGVAFPVA